MGTIIKLRLGNKDNLLKSWWAASEKENTSAIVTGAILYHNRTGDYLNIGKVMVQDMPLCHKNVYFASLPELDAVMEEWQKEHKKVGTEIKKILKYGIQTCSTAEEISIISERELDEVLNAKSKQSYKGKYEGIKQEAPERPSQISNSSNQTLEIDNDEYDDDIRSDSPKKKITTPDGKDFVLGMIPRDIGLGQS